MLKSLVESVLPHGNIRYFLVYSRNTYTANRENLTHERYRYQFTVQERPISYLEGIDLLTEKDSFRCVFIKALKDVNFDSYVWEMPSIINGDDKSVFEFVITKSNGLAKRTPDQDAFSSYFKKSSNPFVTSFFNLSADAKLISPLPENKLTDYSHIAAFMQNASDDHIHAFWKEVGHSMKNMIVDYPKSPLWLSTAGHGVSWLHARIDLTPKYYSYTPYKIKLQSEGDIEWESKQQSDLAYDDNVTKKQAKLDETKNKDDSPSYKRDYSVIEGYNNHGQTMTYSFIYKNKPLTYKEALHKLKYDATFREIMNITIEDCQHQSFVLETTPVSSKSCLEDVFGIVCINANGLKNKSTDQLEFNEILRNSKKSELDEKIIQYIDHREQSIFLIPNPQYENKKYEQMSEFLRGSSNSDKECFWKILSDSITQQLNLDDPSQIIHVSTNCLDASRTNCAYTKIFTTASRNCPYFFCKLL